MNGAVLRPLCFMVMPYGTKATLAEPGKGPVEIDFNALWDNAYVHVIEALGYQPVRADQDTGAMIITQMLERLYFADLVLADMTIANGNVYYEIGIRHAARRKGCVLLAADWSSQLFDLAQMRAVRYPLPEGKILPETAAAIQARIKDAIAGLVAGESPMHAAIPGYPSQVNEATAAGMKDQMAMLSAFQAEVRAVRAFPKKERMARAQALVDAYAKGPMIGAVAIALMLMLRDCADTAEDWNVVLKFIDGLSDELRSVPEVTEQRALALSYAGRHVEAIAAVEALVATSGPTQERLGLLGGRYKRLFKDATAPEDKKRFLARSIDNYERGMQLDLNEYYCSSNLPSLYRIRRRAGDEKLAQSVLQLVIAACERARQRGSTDPWLRATLLVAAFDSGDADKAEALADEVESGDPADWQIKSIIGSLELSLMNAGDDVTMARMAAVIERLRPA
ncbi:TRAFs-binding domain-containing protein [Variovorax rhizosphaerae]|uniref:TRAFs-binding domain-containing protein n=1 Tax=Variovorax rhizosphaerae TaxID=1836200 RepID=A0ABU8WL16_9BURK